MKDCQVRRYLFNIVLEYRKRISIIISLMLISMIIGIYLPLVNQKILDEGFIRYDIISLCKNILICSMLFFLKICIDYWKEKLRIKIYLEFKKKLNLQSFNHLMKMEYFFFNTKNSAEMLNNIERDTENVSRIFDSSIFFTFTQILNIIGGIIGLLLIDFRITICTLLTVPVKVFFSKRFSLINRELSQEYLKVDKENARYFGDAIEGIKEIKLFGVYNNKRCKFQKFQEELYRCEYNLHLLSQKNMLVDNIIAQSIIVLIYFIGAEYFLNGSLTIGSIFSCITYGSYIIQPIALLINVEFQLSGIVPSIKRFLEFMKMKEESETGKIADINDFTGDIVFQNVNFSYEKDKRIISDFNCIFHKSCINIVIGKNGAGKTSLINVLMRFYPLDSGNILIGEKNIKSFTIETYRRNFAVVNQNIYLFQDSIRNNITMYQEFDDDYIYQICEMCEIMDFINSVSLDYNVGERGCRLSGGQLQKIALARAIIMDKPIILVDEMTSNVDSLSTKKILNVFNTALKGKTIIIITHEDEVKNIGDYVINLTY